MGGKVPRRPPKFGGASIDPVAGLARAYSVLYCQATVSFHTVTMTQSISISTLKTAMMTQTHESSIINLATYQNRTPRFKRRPDLACVIYQYQLSLPSL